MKVNLDYATQAAITPNLGGVFTDLRLRVKPFFKKEKSAFMMQTAREIAKERNVKITEVLDSDSELLEMFAEKVISLITDWENITDESGTAIECTDENKKRILYPMMFERVYPKTEDEESPNVAEPVTLSAYVVNFAGDISNYIKN